MQSISLSTNWLSSNPIESCIFVNFVTADVNNGQNYRDSEPNEDIETLLQSSETCVRLQEPNQELGEKSEECKIYIKTKNESEDEMMTTIHSFSMLCSAKVVEIHGNESNEYLKTLFNELVEELDELSMFRSDYHFTEPQKEISFTFKNFKELWIYGLVVKLIRINKKPVILSGGVPNFATIFNMISMFSNSSKGSSSEDLIKKLSKLKTNDESIAESNETNVLPQSGTLSVKSEPIQVQNIDDCETGDQIKTDSSEEQFCRCLCHKSSASDKNTDFLCQYIDQKASDLEKSIENKLNSLENKMFSVLNLFINKQ